jgi:hypothetical protein
VCCIPDPGGWLSSLPPAGAGSASAGTGVSTVSEPWPVGARLAAAGIGRHSLSQPNYKSLRLMQKSGRNHQATPLAKDRELRAGMLDARIYYDTVATPLLDGSLSLAVGSCGRLSRRMRRGGAAGRHARIGSCSLLLAAKSTQYSGNGMGCG